VQVFSSENPPRAWVRRALATRDRGENALAHNADRAKVQEELGHAHVSTTRLHEKRRARPEESPTLKVEY
jgi:hypothetical protein